MRVYKMKEINVLQELEDCDCGFASSVSIICSSN